MDEGSNHQVESTLNNNETFLVIAYRWGNTNNHHYVVYCGLDEMKAIACAKAEVADRGGKYGCAIKAYKDVGDVQKERRVLYLPSMLGELELFHNHRIDMFESLGHRLHDFSEGTIWLPQDNDTFLKPIPVEPPQWVIDEVKRAKDHCEFMEKLDKEKE